MKISLNFKLHECLFCQFGLQNMSQLFEWNLLYTNATIYFRFLQFLLHEIFEEVRYPFEISLLILSEFKRIN